MAEMRKQPDEPLLKKDISSNKKKVKEETIEFKNVTIENNG